MLLLGLCFWKVTLLQEGIHSELLTSVLGATESLLKAGEVLEHFKARPSRQENWSAVQRSVTGREACVEDWPRIFELLLRMKSSEDLPWYTTRLVLRHGRHSLAGVQFAGCRCQHGSLGAAPGQAARHPAECAC